MNSVRAVVRSIGTIGVFTLFGIGALAITPIVLVLRRPDRCHPVIRTLWRLVTRILTLTRLLRIEDGGLKPISGSVIVANHPSLIDVLLIVSLVPRTLYVAKHALKGNPFLATIVRTTALPDDATLPERAAPYLAKGWNVVIFPEGTRSPAEGGLQPLRRGAAQLALRTGSPIACIGIRASQRILGKHQRPWDVGDRTVAYRFSLSVIPAEKPQSTGLHSRAVRLTESIRQIFDQLRT